MYDLVIKNATVYDGTGRDGYSSDIGIREGKIAKIAKNLSGKETIDATSLAVSPGWIDSHSHSDSTFFSYPDQKEKIEQGITFSVTGQCGGSAAPHCKDGEPVTAGEFLKKASQVPQGSGSVMLVGHGTLRRAVMGEVNRHATQEEQKQMEDLLRDAMEHGARGMSLGLIYIPGCYSELDELIPLARIVAEYDGIIASHIRNEGDELEKSVEEFLDLLRVSGCRGVISHHKSSGKKNWGKVHKTMATVDNCNRGGMDVYMDVYPYCASHTGLMATFFPRKFRPEGVADMRAALRDPALRAKLKAWARAKWGDDMSWVLVTKCSAWPEYQGMRVSEIAKLREQDPYEAIYDMICAGEATACFFSMCPEDVSAVIRHERSMICTDSSVGCNRTIYHPRLRGAFPRALRVYVREENAITLPEMIRKMTSLPAKVYGLKGKGQIAEGYDADLCIFDPEAICDRADFTNCTEPNEGLAYVIIDGKVVLRDNTYLGIRAAKVVADPI